MPMYTGVMLIVVALIMSLLSVSRLPLDRNRRLSKFIVPYKKPNIGPNTNLASLTRTPWATARLAPSFLRNQKIVLSHQVLTEFGRSFETWEFRQESKIANLTKNHQPHVNLPESQPQAQPVRPHHRLTCHDSIGSAPRKIHHRPQPSVFCATATCSRLGRPTLQSGSHTSAHRFHSGR
jgi:hypothetical protein